MQFTTRWTDEVSLSLLKDKHLEYQKQGKFLTCNAINAELGIVASAPPIDTAINTAHAFTGTFNATAAGTTIADSGQAPELLGKKTGCIQETTGGGDDYVFYHALIAR